MLKTISVEKEKKQNKYYISIYNMNCQPDYEFYR